MTRRACASILVVLSVTHHGGPAHAAEKLKSNVRQLVVAVADDWDSSVGTLQCFERHRGKWQPVHAQPLAVLFGKSGLAWGRGVLGSDEKGRQKREGDRRAPAGVFEIGMVFGYSAALPKGGDYPYRQIGKWDAWPDDPENPYYNRHVVIDPKHGVPPWFEKQKMRHGDSAYQWLVEVRHNADPPVPGRGSAIFMHTRRGPTRASHGCTVMARADLERMIVWLRKSERPHFVLLPRSEYAKKRASWGLPLYP